MYTYLLLATSVFNPLAQTQNAAEQPAVQNTSPSQTSPQVAAEASQENPNELLPQLDSEAKRRNILAYRRQHLHIEPITRQWAPVTGLSLGGFYGAPWHRSRFSGLGGWGWGWDWPMTTSISNEPNDWVIMRGKADVLTEKEFAEIIDSPGLVRAIEEARFWPRLAWGLGFGLGAVAGIGTGSLLMQSDSRDTRTTGASLITLGVVSGVLALFFPAMGKGHVLSPGEAENLVDLYNEDLRRNLGLRHQDLPTPPTGN